MAGNWLILREIVKLSMHAPKSEPDGCTKSGRDLSLMRQTGAGFKETLNKSGFVIPAKAGIQYFQ